jgi:cytidylate kinase
MVKWSMPKHNSPNYRNITISGLPGSGSTTLLRHLKEQLQFDGWKGFSGGEFMREYAKEKGLFKEEGNLHHDSRHYEDDFDRKIDMGMREKLASEDKWIIESWLSGFLAQQVPGVLKVLVFCSDEAVKIDRVVNRDSVSVDTAKSNMHDRYNANYTKWSRMYADEWKEWVVRPGTFKDSEKIDFWDPRLYDLKIDTYSHNSEATFKAVMDALKQ